jgi:hypothetical protein
VKQSRRGESEPGPTRAPARAPAARAPARGPTSVVLEGLLEEAPGEQVTLAWIVGRLRERSFGIVMLLIALVGLVPGVASVAGLLLAVPAIQMMLGRPGPVLPGFIARRRLSTRRLRRLIARLVPVLRRLERAVRPRWTTPFEATKRVLGGVILLLSATLLAPIPVSQVPPLLAIMLLAVAFLEDDGLLLLVALAAAALSMGLTGMTVWGAVEAGLLL